MPVANPLSIQTPSFASNTTSLELEYFITLLSPSTSFYFGGSPDFIFWDPAALHFLHSTEPAFQHGLAALSLINRAFWDPDAPADFETKYHRRMTQAYGALCACAPRLNQETLLCCALVLLRAELIRRGLHGEAATHMEAILAILAEFEDSIVVDGDSGQADTSQLFYRMILGTSVSLRYLGWDPSRDLVKPRFLNGLSAKPLPDAFESRLHAAVSLESFTVFWVTAAQRCPRTWIREVSHERMAMLLQLWLHAFKNRRHRSEDHPCDGLILAHFEMISLWVREGHGDRFESALQHILSRMTATVTQRQRIQARSQDVLHHLGFIPPLYYVAISAKNEDTSRAALSLLRTLGIEPEPPWNGHVAALLARSIIELRQHPKSAGTVFQSASLERSAEPGQYLICISCRDGWHEESTAFFSYLTIKDDQDVEACEAATWVDFSQLRRP